MEEISRISTLNFSFVLAAPTFGPNVQAPSVHEIPHETKHNSSSSTMYLLSETTIFFIECSNINIHEMNNMMKAIGQVLINMENKNKALTMRLQ